MNHPCFLGSVAVALFLRSLSAGETPVRVERDSKPVHEGIRSYTMRSPYQKGPNTVEVLLPDDQTSGRRYPVIYLLPVNTGTDGQWGSGIVEARRLDLANRYGVIFVGPAYEVLPWFGDNPGDAGTRQNSHLLEAVIPFVDAEFPTMAGPEGRHLIGFSKSGLGGLGIFLRHLDRFGRIAVFDPSDGPPTQGSYIEWGFAATYGPRENYDHYDPFLLLKAHRNELAAGPVRITLLAGGPGSRVGVDAYRSALSDAGIPYVFILGSQMSHTWTSGWLPLAVASVMNEVPAAPSNQH